MSQCNFGNGFSLLAALVMSIALAGCQTGEDTGTPEKTANKPACCCGTPSRSMLKVVRSGASRDETPTATEHAEGEKN